MHRNVHKWSRAFLSNTEHSWAWIHTSLHFVKLYEAQLWHPWPAVTFTLTKVAGVMLVFFLWCILYTKWKLNNNKKTKGGLGTISAAEIFLTGQNWETINCNKPKKKQKQKQLWLLYIVCIPLYTCILSAHLCISPTYYCILSAYLCIPPTYYCILSAYLSRLERNLGIWECAMQSRDWVTSQIVQNIYTIK